MWRWYNGTRNCNRSKKFIYQLSKPAEVFHQAEFITFQKSTGRCIPGSKGCILWSRKRRDPRNHRKERKRKIHHAQSTGRHFFTGYGKHWPKKPFRFPSVDRCRIWKRDERKRKHHSFRYASWFFGRVYSFQDGWDHWIRRTWQIYWYAGAYLLKRYVFQARIFYYGHSWNRYHADWWGAQCRWWEVQEEELWEDEITDLTAQPDGCYCVT